MNAVKSLDYGTVEPVVPQRARSKKTVAVVAAFLVCAAVFALAFGTGSNKTNGVVNSNIGRSSIVGTSDDLKALFGSICADETMRYAIATFAEDGKSVIPCVTRAATDQWENDFNVFKESLTTCTDLSPIKVAFAVYNQPVWTDDSHTSYGLYSSFVHYIREQTDVASEMIGATFLGQIKLDSQCAKYNFGIKLTDGYSQACKQLGKYGISEKQCELIEDSQCPFGDSPENPCLSGQCANLDGGSFFTESGSFGEECCLDIRTWCENTHTSDSPAPGCGDYAYKRIYEEHCNPAWETSPLPEVVPHHPQLMMTGTSYCTYAPNMECYASGYPACCSKDPGSCPEEADPCDIAIIGGGDPIVGTPTPTPTPSLSPSPSGDGDGGGDGGGNYCMYSPDYSCYPSTEGFPGCCTYDPESCPEEADACEGGYGNDDVTM